MLDKYSLLMPQSVRCGRGTIYELPELIDSWKVKTIAMVIDHGVSKNEAVENIARQLSSLYQTIIITDVPKEPEEGQVRAIADRILNTGAELIVAIGGGSVMDSAKFFSVMMTNPGYYDDLTDRSKIQRRGIPLICLPTSAGTGSEATPNAIILIPEKHLKVGVVHDYFLPSQVILDPLLTQTLPQSYTASTGLDAFCHCLETYISKKTNPFARTFGLEGLRLISQNIRRAYQDGNDLQAREAMSVAAFYGGVAITASSTVAIHALSYPLGGTYRIAHGISNAILLPYVMKFNIDAIEKDIPAICSAMGLDVSGEPVTRQGEAMIEEIFRLCRDLNIPENLKPFGVPEDDLDRLAQSASEVHRLLDQNPKTMSLEDIKSIYLQLL